jgi:hypothetical protein
MFCEGRLGLCVICGGFEGSLLTTCPGYKLNGDTIDACYNGNIKDLDCFRIAITHGARIKHGKIVWR